MPILLLNEPSINTPLPVRPSVVAAVLSDIPETPPYFARMKRINTAGPPLLGDRETRRLPSIKPAAAGRNRTFSQ